MVYVLNKNGEPLMPTENHAKVRVLLKQGRAKVVKRTPFTIRLLYGTTGYAQDICLGVDTGIRHIGMCASSENKVLYQSETIARTDISDNLKVRRQLRRGRRARKTRYRKAKFLNRTHSKHKGWLAPSIESLIGNHLTEIRRACTLLPVTAIRIETAEFDIHKIKDATVSGVDYQFGEKHGFEQNTRNYILFRDNHKCRFCGKTAGKLYVISANGQPTEAPEDLYTACRECFLDICKGKVAVPKKRYFAPPTKMGIMRDTLLKRAVGEFRIPVIKTTGAETKRIRETEGIPKSHINDAFAIAGNLNAKPLTEYYLRKKVRCHNRQTHKMTFSKGGVRKANQAPYKVKGYRLYDIVKANGSEWYIHGRRLKGSFVLKNLSAKTLEIAPSKIKLVCQQSYYLTERRSALLS